MVPAGMAVTLTRGAHQNPSQEERAAFANDIGADLSWCGRNGSPTKVHRIQSVVLAGGEYREFPPTDEGMTQLVGELIDDHTIG